ncbi:MAG: phytanoyl-CoA dioxygenase [Alphaproteobacteria bacterium]|nr:phytanoyl-CoA dioxygenase [Alphaproteobacteria bacterium]
MPKMLSEEQVQQYKRDGYVSPLRVMSESDAAEILKEIKAFEQKQGKSIFGIQRTKACLLFPFIYEMVTRKTILDAIEDLIGPDILVYQNAAWLKEADGKGFVSWHQDSTYFGMDPWDLVSAWVALSPAGIREGCMEVLPGTQELGMLPFDYSAMDKANMLASGQQAIYNVDESKAVAMPLRPGEMSLHHVNLLHCSRPNNGAERRVGFSIACCPPSVRQTTEVKTSAMLLRGEDQFGHYEFDEKPPISSDDSATIAAHAKAVELYRLKVVECGNENARRLD